MKYALAVWLFAILGIAYADIVDLRFGWDAPDPPDDRIVGYRLWDAAPGEEFAPLAEFDVGTTGEASITMRPGETRIFAMTAFSQDAESDYSNEVDFTLPVTPEEPVAPPVTPGGEVEVDRRSNRGGGCFIGAGGRQN